MLLDIICVWQIPFLAYGFAFENTGSLRFNLPPASACVGIFPSFGFVALHLGGKEEN